MIHPSLLRSIRRLGGGQQRLGGRSDLVALLLGSWKAWRKDERGKKEGKETEVLSQAQRNSINVGVVWVQLLQRGRFRRIWISGGDKG